MVMEKATGDRGVALYALYTNDRKIDFHGGREPLTIDSSWLSVWGNQIDELNIQSKRLLGLLIFRIMRA